MIRKIIKILDPINHRTRRFLLFGFNILNCHRWQQIVKIVRE